MSALSKAEEFVSPYAANTCLINENLAFANEDDLSKDIHDRGTDFSHDQWADDGGNQWIRYGRESESGAA